METDEVFMNLLRGNWANSRHQESQRMWFANIFSVIFLGVLTYVTKEGLGKLPLLLPLGLFAISIICLLVTLKVNRVFDDYKNSIKNILDDKKIPLGLCEKQSWGKYVGMFKSDEFRRWRKLRVRYLCIALYSTGIAASIALIVLAIVN